MRISCRTLLFCLLASGLGWLVGRSSVRQQGAKGSSVASPSSFSTTKTGTRPDVAPLRASLPTSSTNAPRSFDWRQVESADYRVYIANLRAIGCPEETVIDIVRADVQKLYDERVRSMKHALGEYPFWRTDTTGWETNFRSQLQSLREEQRAVLKTLLGITLPEPAADTLAPASDPRLAFLDPAVHSQVLAINKSYSERLANLLSGSGDAGGDDPLGDLRAERDAALDELLGADLRQEVELRISPLAGEVRQKIQGASATEAQFRQIFRLHQEFNREFPPSPFAFLESTERTRRRSEAEALLAEQTRTILGELR